jgi:cell division protein FtsW (lipid II flippase)
VKNIFLLIPPLMLIAVPAALVVKQPDLGTAILLGAGGITIMFMAGASLWFFVLLGGGAIGTVWAVMASRGQDWQILKDYQYSSTPPSTRAGPAITSRNRKSPSGPVGIAAWALPRGRKAA